MPALPAVALIVCLQISPSLSLGGPEAIVFEELNSIWRPLGVSISRDSSGDECHRLIMVRADTEALPEDRSAAAALGWVPFVGGQARQLVFLRAARVRALVAELGQGPRLEGVTQMLTARLVGRTLAHELGHVLLNSKVHTASGLMRASYRAADVLREPLSTYTLDPSERAQLFTRAGREAIARR